MVEKKQQARLDAAAFVLDSVDHVFWKSRIMETKRRGKETKRIRGKLEDLARSHSLR